MFAYPIARQDLSFVLQLWPGDHLNYIFVAWVDIRGPFSFLQIGDLVVLEKLVDGQFSIISPTTVDEMMTAMIGTTTLRVSFDRMPAECKSCF